MQSGRNPVGLKGPPWLAHKPWGKPKPGENFHPAGLKCSAGTKFWAPGEVHARNLGPYAQGEREHTFLPFRAFGGFGIFARREKRWIITRGTSKSFGRRGEHNLFRHEEGGERRGIPGITQSFMK